MTKQERLLSIDFLRGISIIMIYYCHVAMAWKGDDWYSLFIFLWLILDFFGMPMFATISTIGKMRSYFAGDEKVFSFSTIIHATYLLAVGSAIHLVYVLCGVCTSILPFNIVVFVAFNQIFTPFLLKMRKFMRFSLLILLSVTYFFVLYYAPYPVVSFFLMSVQMPIYPFIIIPIFVTIIAEDYFTREGSRVELQRMILYAAIAIFISILVGSRITLGVYGEGYRADLYHDDQFQFWNFVGLPMFMIRPYPQFLIYNSGIDLFLLGILLYVERFTGRKRVFNARIISLGRLSLTHYCFAAVFMIIPFSFSFLSYHLIFVGLITLVIFSFSIIDVKHNKFGTIEWGMGVYSRAVTLFIERRRNDGRINHQRNVY